MASKSKQDSGRQLTHVLVPHAGWIPVTKILDDTNEAMLTIEAPGIDSVRGPLTEIEIVRAHIVAWKYKR